MSINRPQTFSPLLLGALFAASSCGSSPPAEPPPPQELVVEAAPIEEPTQAAEAQPELDRQLADMQAALASAVEGAPAAEPDPADGEPLLASEVQPQAEEQPLEEPVVEQTAVEKVASEVEGLFLDPGEVFPVEIMDGVPGQMAMQVSEPEEPIVEEVPFELVVEAPEVAAVEEPDTAGTDEPVAAAVEEPEKSVAAVAEAPEPAEELLGAAPEDLAALTEAFADPGAMPPDVVVEVAEDDTLMTTEDDTPTAAEGTALEPTEAIDFSEFLEVTETDGTELVELTPEPADELAQVALEDGQVVSEEPEQLVWHVVVPEPVHIEVAARPEGQELEVAAVEPVEGGPEALEIETVVETPVATAMQPSVLSGLMGFTQALDPKQRLLIGPLFLVDPSGGLAQLSMGFLGLAESTVQMTAGPPGDPSLVGLKRSNGSEFDPVPVEQGQLTGDPGLGMIWWSNEVPVAQVASKAEVQTPSVGRIRAVLNSGDYVEGVLHSVGMGQYWIDGDLGRFAVRAGLVAHIEHLPKPGLGVETKGLQAGDLVRAKAKTGYIEGRLVSLKDGKALIETATGMRITIQNAEVEPLGASKTRVVID